VFEVMQLVVILRHMSAVLAGSQHTRKPVHRQPIAARLVSTMETIEQIWGAVIEEKEFSRGIAYSRVMMLPILASP
jgi:hypothetical protein